MAIEAGAGGVVFLLARVLLGGVLAFMGLNHFMQTDGMAGYAEAKGLPAPRASVLLSGGLLVFAGLGVATGIAPVLSAGALVVFLLSSAVVFHDFWSVDDPEQAQNEMTQFLKNAALTGGALAVLAVGDVVWPYSVGVTLLG
jgi:putative oxidoreductase